MRLHRLRRNRVVDVDRAHRAARERSNVLDHPPDLPGGDRVAVEPAQRAAALRGQAGSLAGGLERVHQAVVDAVGAGEREQRGVGGRGPARR